VEKFEDRVLISGIGISRIARRSGRTGMEHALEASLGAIGDAGLNIKDIDGIASIGDVAVDSLQDALGLKVEWTGGGGSGAQLSAVFSGCLAVAAGLCRHVLVYRSVEMMGGEPPAGRALGWTEWLLPFGAYSAAHWLAMNAQRHMHLYGTTKEQLGWIAMTCRAHAALNDLAAYRAPLTMEQYLDCRPMTDPFGLLDCDAPVDGAVAVVVSRSDHIQDCPNGGVRVAAVGCAVRGRPSWDQGADYPATGAAGAAAQLWSRTDIRPTDVDVAELYDGFTFLVLDWLEALQFCAMGESGPFVEGGRRISLGGDLPLNTYGGQLSAGRMHGYWLLHEACLQLRHQAGGRQVDGAEVAVASVGGGPYAGCVLLTR